MHTHSFGHLTTVHSPGCPQDTTVPLFKVTPSPSELSFTLKQVFENVGRKIDCHWKAAFRFQSSFYCYSETVYCLNYPILSWLWVFKQPNKYTNRNRIIAGLYNYYWGFSLSTQTRDGVYAYLHFITYLISLHFCVNNLNKDTSLFKNLKRGKTKQ